MSTNKTSKTYTIMKDGNKIKTAKSLNAAKAIADQEQAEVFCGDECVYKPQPQATEASQTAEASEEVKAVDTVHAVQSSEVQSDVGDNGIEAKPAAKEETAASKEEASVSDMAAANPSADKAVNSASGTAVPTVATTTVEEEPILGVAIHSSPHTPQPKFENYRLTALMNVRAAPSLTSKVLRTAPSGTVVQVCKFENFENTGSGGNCGGNWMKIRNGSDFAYILYEKDGKKFAEKVGV